MEALFIGNIELDSYEGIYKKVHAQAKAIAECVGSCELITRQGKNARVQKWDSDKPNQISVSFLDYIKKRVSSGLVGFIYVRHMIPSPKLISVLRYAKLNGVKIYYEIPTYPYFGEQFKASRRKYRAIVKILLDVVYWPFIYRQIDKLVVIKSNTKVKMYSKMVEISNGIDTDNIKEKSYNKKSFNIFRMVTVGTLYPYHGYDRVLQGLANCKETVEGIPVEFHIIGNSKTIDDLQRMVGSLGLKRVYFHGVKTTEELNDMYDNFQVGLGCLALHRRNANIDTTLKVIEYYCRGIPVITSGFTPLGEDKFTYVVPDDESAIDIAQIINYYRNINYDDLKTLSAIAKQRFSWINILSAIIR